MGLCYSLRPRLFGDAGGSISSSAGAASEPEPPAEPHAAPQPQPLGEGALLRPGGKPGGGEADGPPLLLQNGGGNGAAPERPSLPKAGGPGGGKAARQQQTQHPPPALQRPWEKLRLEEREAEKEARKVSKSIDRALKEQKREYKQTHRLLLLGTCGASGRGQVSGGAAAAPLCLPAPLRPPPALPRAVSTPCRPPPPPPPSPPPPGCGPADADGSSPAAGREGAGEKRGKKWPRRDVRLRGGFPGCRWGRGVAGAASSCGGAGRGLRATWAGLFLAQPSPQDAGPQSLSSALVPAFRLRGATCGLLLRCSF